MSNLIKIIHISDLHFAGTPGVYSFIDATVSQTIHAGVGAAENFFNGRHNPELAEIAGDFIVRRLMDHDCLLVSGDLATRGTPADLKVAEDYILTPSAFSNGYLTVDNRPTLNVAGRPIALMPGNHDRFQNSSCIPGSRSFEEVFHDYWKKVHIRFAQLELLIPLAFLLTS